MSTMAVGHLEHLLLAVVTAAVFAVLLPVAAWVDRAMAGRHG